MNGEVMRTGELLPSRHARSAAGRLGADEANGKERQSKSAPATLGTVDSSEVATDTTPDSIIDLLHLLNSSPQKHSEGDSEPLNPHQSPDMLRKLTGMQEAHLAKQASC